ncbi:MAG: DinB family protein [Bacteroidetes bacterium]|nr:DinB family protein [Bacteroidota bacterium]
MPKPSASEYPEYYEHYIGLVKDDDLNTALKNNQQATHEFLIAIPEERGDYKYAPEKWTLKQVLMHVMDTERIFNYRALSLARKESNSLAGHDHEEYAAVSGSNARSLSSIADELKDVRAASIVLFNNFDEEMLTQMGVANKNKVSVNAIGFMIAGHEQHHIDFIKEKYL